MLSRYLGQLTTEDPSYGTISAKIPAELVQMVKMAILANPEVEDISSLVEGLLEDWLKQQEIYTYLANKKNLASN